MRGKSQILWRRDLLRKLELGQTLRLYLLQTGYQNLAEEYIQTFHRSMWHKSCVGARVKCIPLSSKFNSPDKTMEQIIYYNWTLIGVLLNKNVQRRQMTVSIFTWGRPLGLWQFFKLLLSICKFSECTFFWFKIHQSSWWRYYRRLHQRNCKQFMRWSVPGLPLADPRSTNYPRIRVRYYSI